MNREDVIRLAREAGLLNSGILRGATDDSVRVERFAALVEEATLTKQKAQYYQEGYEAGARDEREACGMLADEMLRAVDSMPLIEAIRARGEP